jgi:hypothetical protein
MELLELLEYFVFIFIIMNLLQNLTDPRCDTAVLKPAAVLQKKRTSFPESEHAISSTDLTHKKT